MDGLDMTRTCSVGPGMDVISMERGNHVWAIHVWTRHGWAMHGWTTHGWGIRDYRKIYQPFPRYAWMDKVWLGYV